MIKEIKCPNREEYKDTDCKIFLAGSIEGGTAAPWQHYVVEELKKNKSIKKDVIIFNPRRDQWDSEWEQSIDNTPFVEQVTWELNHMEYANIIIMCFQPGTKSPISLLELGLWAKETANKQKTMLVLCPDDFWRKGNVDVVCKYYNIEQVASMKELINKTAELIKQGQATKKKKFEIAFAKLGKEMDDKLTDLGG